MVDESKIYTDGRGFYRVQGRTRTGRYRLQGVTYHFDGKVLKFIYAGYQGNWTEKNFELNFRITEYNVADTPALCSPPERFRFGRGE